MWDSHKKENTVPNADPSPIPPHPFSYPQEEGRFARLAAQCGLTASELRAWTGTSLERFNEFESGWALPTGVEFASMLAAADVTYQALPDDDPLKHAPRPGLPRHLIEAAFEQLFADVDAEHTTDLMARLEEAAGGDE